MEAIYFAVGVLTMVLLAVASLAVYSTVMVLKLKDEIKLIHKMIDDVYGTIQHNDMEQSGENNVLYRRIDELNSYTDRRFDKLIDTYILVKETEKESKKLIKG
jgi:hypothetical protein